MTPTQTKVTAYITREIEGKIQLLTMTSNDTNWAGIEVPGGTVDPGESLEAALFREIEEEANMTEVEILSYLGEHDYISRTTNELIKRHNYHLFFTGESEDAFTVVVKSDDKDNGWVYKYKWVTLDKNAPIKLEEKLTPGLEKLYDLF